MTDQSVVPVGESSRTSSTLLRAAAAQNATAWMEIVDRYGPLVYRFARRHGLQPACANDVVQEVFTAVAKNLATFRHDRPGDSFRSWLLTITWNKLRDRGRQNRRSPKAAGGSDAQAVFQALSFSQSNSTTLEKLPDERMLLVRKAIDQVREEVSDEKWAIFCSVVIDGCSPKEAAAIFGTTTNVVYLAKSRILHRLRQELESLSVVEK